MKNPIFTLLLALLFCQGSTTFAQTASPDKPTRYSVYAYMKVKPGMESNYLK